MKTKQFSIIKILIFCILTQASYAQEKQTMVQLENLKGKVKSIHITNENSLYVKVWFDETGKIIKKEEGGEYIMVWDNYVYDEEGRLLSINEYLPASSKRYKITYKYINGSSGGFHFGETPENQRNYEMRESYFEGTSKNQRSYKYDERGNCILEICRYHNDDYGYKELIYNESNQLIEAFSHKGPERMNIWKTDIDGRRSYEVTKWTEPMKTHHTFFEYNGPGDVSLITLKTINGYTPLDKKGVIIYKQYDQAGNWLEKIHPGKSSDDHDIYYSYNLYYNTYETYLSGFHIIRTIEYYE